MANPALEIAETIQTASINFHPSPEHDINPSTAASTKVPVTTSDPPGNDDVEDETHVSILRPQRRKNTLPPLPDLRFEQSYLASIKGAETSGQVAWITIRDQVCNPLPEGTACLGMFLKGRLTQMKVFLPLMQGTLWSLALHGWRYWNRNASFSGKTLGCMFAQPALPLWCSLILWISSD